MCFSDVLGSRERPPHTDRPVARGNNVFLALVDNLIQRVFPHAKMRLCRNASPVHSGCRSPPNPRFGDVSQRHDTTRPACRCDRRDSETETAGRLARPGDRRPTDDRSHAERSTQRSRSGLLTGATKAKTVAMTTSKRGADNECATRSRPAKNARRLGRSSLGSWRHACIISAGIARRSLSNLDLKGELS